MGIVKNGIVRTEPELKLGIESRQRESLKEFKVEFPVRVFIFTVYCIIILFNIKWENETLDFIIRCFYIFYIGEP